jgi:hypothetical protein
MVITVYNLEYWTFACLILQYSFYVQYAVRQTKPFMQYLSDDLESERVTVLHIISS